MTWQCVVMYGIGLLLIFLAIKKNCEPQLLLPLGFGAILVNLPHSSGGILEWLFNVGIQNSEAMPFLLFLGIGAMIDFGPLLKNPLFILFGIFSQAGVFIVFKVAMALGFSPNDAASIGMIGSADGPTAILVSQKLKSAYTGQIAVAAYSYIALVPIIQPLVAKILVSKKEKKIRAEECDKFPKEISSKNDRLIRIIFPIGMTFLSGLIAPESAQLTGFLMFGNLLRECGILNTMAETARTVLVNLITLLLGITISFTLKANDFIQMKTLLILALGFLAFVFDISFGILSAKFLNLFRKRKINPLIGSAGNSAFPISSHVAQKIALKEDSSNIILMQCVAANVSGQIFSAIIGGILIHMGMGF